ncbi:IS110 family transposase [uncultured Duncaniella sp.]|uniref:IS110 family transposase n=2 Tax=uncultured Duncaniella sp. TaxID=2768039 RepID=UPI00344B280D
MPMQSNKISFKGENVYVGIDVHLKQWHVCVRSSFLSPKPFSQPPSARLLHAYLTRMFPDAVYHSAYEVGFSGFSAHFELLDCGINNIVFNPADICDSQKERARKSDAVDCTKICRNLQQGTLRAIHIPARDALDDRALLRGRKMLVKERARTKQRIKSLLYLQGVAYPEDFADNRSHWSRRFIMWLEGVFEEPDSGCATQMAILLRNLRFINVELLSLDRQIAGLIRRKHSRTDTLLRSIPGIGALTSAKLALIIGDINRFDTTDSLAGYVGLVPDIRSSADKETVLGITFRGHRVLRSALIESSWRAIALDPALGKAFSDYRQRGMHPNKAIVRIARKLVNRIYHVLKKGVQYEPGVVR